MDILKVKDLSLRFFTQRFFTQTRTKDCRDPLRKIKKEKEKRYKAFSYSLPASVSADKLN